jgi:gamma-glutamylcyclotransferase (GGCT)/AIG2-like uncharacterized protein YtfP
MKFGIEYETCVKSISSNKELPWIIHLEMYISMIQTHYKNLSPEIIKWCNTFENIILITDDNNKKWQFFLTDNNIPILSNIINNDYKYPELTIDSSLVCHMTLRGKDPTEYSLDNDFTINLEIISQIMYNDIEINMFFELFINPYIYKKIFIKNKSQGIHINIDVSEYDDNTIRKIIKDRYISWEKYKGTIVRRFPSVWAKPLNYKNEILLNNINLPLENILSKQRSIRYKSSQQIIEFRILTPETLNVIDEIKFLLSLFKSKQMGGKIKGTRKQGNKETIKNKKNKLINIFVYGSLRTEMSNAHLLATSKYYGTYNTVDGFYMIGLKSKSYPYVMTKNIDDSFFKSKITGELYGITKKTLKILDEMEGHPHVYLRKCIRIQANGIIKNAYIYILENEDLISGIKQGLHKRFIPINSGDWKEFVTRV